MPRHHWQRGRIRVHRAINADEGELPILSTSSTPQPDMNVQQTLHGPSEVNAYHPFESPGFDDYITTTLADFLAPGLTIAVVHGDKTFSRAYGHANLDTKEPMTPRTLFYAGSTTKSFTAAAMSHLVDSNASDYAAITWTSKLADLIRDDFVLQDEHATNHITLTDALSHRTGMPRHDMSWINGDPSAREQVRRLRHLPLHHELRETWEYCNLMFTAVSHAIETLTGAAMGTLLREWFWEPLGMRETFYSIQDALAHAEATDGVTMATGYLYDNSSKSYTSVPHSTIPPANGAGGVISNVLDYTHWIRAFLHPSNPSNPVSPAAIQAMTSPHMLMRPGIQPTQGAAYGLGLETSLYRGQRVVAHEGGINGYMTAMLWLSDLDWGVVMMQNAYSLAMEVIQWKIVDDFLRTPEAERADVARAARGLQAKKLARLANARRELYPDAGAVAAVAPALPLQAYEGTYAHPAYHNLTLSSSPPTERGEEAALGSLALYSASAHYLQVSAVWDHVSGEEWYAHERVGPGSFLADDLKKARFRVGVDGKVRGVEYQAESALDEMAWFERIA
ncbi:hypothetical protein LTR53_008255 [Teratosphaeriaceae sp. CCFEE 6253]|nr:hypothetical protein LTR53_008255 [Teratosphaeriaceae sp. CCFEE 6253]